MPVQMTIEPIYPNPRNYPENLLKKLDRELEDVLQGFVKETLKSEFRKRVRGWSHSPEWVGRFAYMRAARGDDPTMTVYPRGQYRERYAWVSRGTEGRWISVKRAKYLRYRHYMPHTRAGDFYGGVGQYYGPIKKAKRVWNPGVEARHFEEVIKFKSQPKIENAVQLAVFRALK